MVWYLSFWRKSRSSGKAPRKRTFLPFAETLEARTMPANFAPTTGEELRSDILTADGNGDAANTITLSGSSYLLTNRS